VWLQDEIIPFYVLSKNLIHSSDDGEIGLSVTMDNSDLSVMSVSISSASSNDTNYPSITEDSSLSGDDDIQISHEDSSRLPDWQQLVDSVVVPAWLLELDPNWRPSELMDIKAVQKIHCNPKYVSLYKDFVEKSLKPISQKIMKIFSGTKMQANSLTLLPHETQAQKEKMLSLIENLKQQSASPLDENLSEDLDLVMQFSIKELFEYSADAKLMEKKVCQYITTKRTKKGTIRAVSTTRAYCGALFGSANPNNLYSFLRKSFGREMSVGDLMFKTSGFAQQIDEYSFETFIFPDDSEEDGALGASSATHLVNGMLNLIDYLATAANRVVIEVDNATHVCSKTNYLTYLENLRSSVSRHHTALHNLALKSPKHKEFQKELVNPGERVRRGNAFEDYFREDHYNMVLIEIMDSAKKCSESIPGKCINDNQFRRYGHFLMVVINLLNGNRTHSSELLKNKHVRQKCKVTQGIADKYTSIQAHREAILNGDFVAYSVGLDTTKEHDKVDVSDMLVPKEVAVG
jgi:hypothetical protein